MNLTPYESEMLQGKHGKGVQFAMEVLVKMGDLYGAKRFLPVKNAHIDAAAYTSIWDAGIDFLEFMTAHDTKVAVPTTINPLACDPRRWKEFGNSEAFFMKSKRMEDAYLKMGVIPTWTCSPYQCTNVPQFGEVISWSESNAVNYVNSVIGARAERLPDIVDVCCAVAGRVPEYGMYLHENRKGDILFVLEGFDDSWFQDSVDYAVLGYYIGEIVIHKVPVVEGLPERTMPDDLKAFSAAAASGGAVSLFHAIGFTPEAPTRDAAFHGQTDYATKIVTPEHLLDVKKRLSTAVGHRADMVLMGCPHLSVNEIQQMAAAMQGRSVHAGTKFWVMTSDVHYQLAYRSGAVQILEDAGVQFSRDACVMDMEEGDYKWAGHNMVTNSGKIAQYAPGVNKVNIYLTTLQGCIEAAVTGRIPEVE